MKYLPTIVCICTLCFLISLGVHATAQAQESDTSETTLSPEDSTDDSADQPEDAEELSEDSIPPAFYELIDCRLNTYGVEFGLWHYTAPITVTLVPEGHTIPAQEVCGYAKTLEENIDTLGAQSRLAGVIASSVRRLASGQASKEPAQDAQDMRQLASYFEDDTVEHVAQTLKEIAGEIHTMADSLGEQPLHERATLIEEQAMALHALSADSTFHETKKQARSFLREIADGLENDIKPDINGSDLRLLSENLKRLDIDLLRISEPTHEYIVDLFWYSGINTTTDTYLFAYTNAENVRMIIDFTQNNEGEQEAHLYVRTHEETHLVGNIRLRIGEDYAFEPHPDGGYSLVVDMYGGHPYMVMRPLGGSWLVDGKTNYNLDITIDGTWPPGHHAFNWQKTNGNMNWLVDVRGETPGVADWYTRVVNPENDQNPDWGYERFGGGYRIKASERFPDEPPFKVARPLIPTFRYFDMGLSSLDAGKEHEQAGGAVEWFEQNPMPLYFNLRGGYFAIYPFHGFQNAGVSYYNSTSTLPTINFEVPFSFYSFNANSRYPQLVVRGSYYPKGDRFSRVRDVSKNTLSFRYSWKIPIEALSARLQDEEEMGETDATEDAEGAEDEEDLPEKKWTYSLDVASVDYAFDELEVLGEHTFLGIRADNLPTWVISKEWAIATFVESIEGYGSSEGIYAYTSNGADFFPWYSGQTNEKPGYFEHPLLEAGVVITLTKKSNIGLPENFRGEYNAAYFQKPRVTFSPIDKRLHLWDAEGGVWNLGFNKHGRQIILRTHNLQKDPFIDGWTLEAIPIQQPTDEEIELALKDLKQPWWPQALPADSTYESLYALHGYIIYTGEEKSLLRKADYTLSAFDRQPPADKQHWLELNELLAQHETEERDPRNLSSWLDAFPGDIIISNPGTITNVRATQTGFRFVIDIQPGYTIQTMYGSENLELGEHVVVYEHGTFRIEPVTLPKPRIVLTNNSALTQNLPGMLMMSLHNDGNMDFHATVEVSATKGFGSKKHQIVHKEVEFLADEVITQTVEWTPTSAGDWTITPWVFHPAGVIIPSKSLETKVHPAPPAGSFEMLNVTAPQEARVMIVVLLVAFASLAAITLWYCGLQTPITKPTPKQKRVPHVAEPATPAAGMRPVEGAQRVTVAPLYNPPDTQAQPIEALE